MAGHEVGTHEADQRCQSLIATASPFAPPKQTPVTKFTTSGFTMDCIFANSGKRGDAIIWDGEIVSKNGKPSRTCRAINQQIIGELGADASEGLVGTVQLYHSAQQ